MRLDSQQDLGSLTLSGHVTVCGQVTRSKMMTTARRGPSEKPVFLRNPLP
jgi:hypothetical protein